jgi:hypothetical protein
MHFCHKSGYLDGLHEMLLHLELRSQHVMINVLKKA